MKEAMKCGKSKHEIGYEMGEVKHEIGFEMGEVQT